MLYYDIFPPILDMMYNYTFTHIYIWFIFIVFPMMFMVYDLIRLLDDLFSNLIQS